MAAVKATVSPAYPGHVLNVGASSSEVARVQKYLNALAAVHTSLPRLTVDGKYGSGTRKAVEAYQRLIPGLSVDGSVGPATWDALVGEYNSRYGGSADTYPGITLRPGDQSKDIGRMQQYLNALAAVYTAINTQTVDNKYGGRMSDAVRRFQKQFGLSPDAILGSATWDFIVRVHQAVQNRQRPNVTTAYPGLMQQGTTGDGVRFLQSYLNGVRPANALHVDGKFGSATTQAVKHFQLASGLKADGIAGRATWAKLIPAYNAR